jgi:hypothetical protein
VALVSGVAVDDAHVYWGEGSSGGMDLIRSSTGSGSATTLTSGSYFAQALAVGGTEVYFADYTTSNVSRPPTASWPRLT